MYNFQVSICCALHFLFGSRNDDTALTAKKQWINVRFHHQKNSWEGLLTSSSFSMSFEQFFSEFNCYFQRTLPRNFVKCQTVVWFSAFSFGASFDKPISSEECTTFDWSLIMRASYRSVVAATNVSLC